MKKARLIVTYKCHKDCAWCCNKNWRGTPARPIGVMALYSHEMVMITGGEPLLFPDKLEDLLYALKMNSSAMRIVYTAKTNGLMALLPYTDGITLTLHDPEDVLPFLQMVKYNQYALSNYRGMLRLNVFRSSGYKHNSLAQMFAHKWVDWIKDCPLPPDEELVVLRKPWVC